MKTFKLFLKLIAEPFRKADAERPLRWRMGMRWSHMPKWFKSIPCKVFGHKWGRWENTKYADRPDHRNCDCCGKLQSKI